ncbi:ABC transporter permease subunit [Longispora sp. NPDC051575]|uniref:ABC transporter permease n=1 Tax=Longispora sp. NPDC051575 TaxID=3154943 RepID=UPI00341520D1
MSAVDAPARVGRPTTRFFRSELMLIFGRRRNWVGLAILAAVPLIIAIAVKVDNPDNGGGGGGDFFSAITDNGLFVGLAALMVEIPLFLPLAVATISGDSIAGEANQGTLRYLLAVPVTRARLLAVKFGALVVFSATATLAVAVTGVVAGLALFGGGPMTLLSGTQIGFWGGVGRLLLVCGYVTVCLTALAAIGLFFSTLTEQPIGAGVAVLMLTIVSTILDAIPQLSFLGPYLPTHYWYAFGDLLRDPIAMNSVGPGLLSAAVYTAIFTTAAWARFSSKDVTS